MLHSLHDERQRTLILFREVEFWVVGFEQAFDDVLPDPGLLFALNDGCSLEPPLVGAGQAVKHLHVFVMYGLDPLWPDILNRFPKCISNI